MSQSQEISLLFQDGVSERDFIAVNSQSGVAPDLYFEFRTVMNMSHYGSGSQLQTLVYGPVGYQSSQPLLARFDWVARLVGSFKIFITNPVLEQPMASLCVPQTPTSRLFAFSSGASRNEYIWTRVNSNYVLTSTTSTACLATYERYNNPPDRPPHAILRLYFKDRLLLLVSLLSLSVNRWLDGPNSPLHTNT